MVDRTSLFVELGLFSIDGDLKEKQSSEIFHLIPRVLVEAFSDISGKFRGKRWS